MHDNWTLNSTKMNHTLEAIQCNQIDNNKKQEGSCPFAGGEMTLKFTTNLSHAMHFHCKIYTT